MAIKDDSKDLDSIVVIGGERTTIAKVQKLYASLEFLSKNSAMSVANVLLGTKEPLTRGQIAKQTQLSTGYTIDILNDLVRYGYVAQFHIGKRKLIYYALTVKGFEALTSKREKTPTS